MQRQDGVLGSAGSPVEGGLGVENGVVAERTGVLGGGSADARLPGTGGKTCVFWETLS